MDAELDPAADFIWGSVGTVVTRAGVEERQPHTEEEWHELRRRVITLVEAANLLVLPGRRVASAGFPSAGPGVLSSADIERSLASDPASFAAFAVALREVAIRTLHAVDAKNVAALSDAGESLDNACEACHRAKWYPHEVIPALPDFNSVN